MEVMTHNTQLLIATERERWLKLHLEHGMTIYELKRRSGFSRDTLHRWKRAYLSCGLEGLRECSRAHHSYPHQTPEDIVQRIRELRTTIPRYGAKKIAMRLEKRYGIVCHWQTVHKVLRREKLVTKRKRLIRKDLWQSKTTSPGELIEMDVAYAKKHKEKWLYQLRFKFKVLKQITVRYSPITTPDTRKALILRIQRFMCLTERVRSLVWSIISLIRVNLRKMER